MKQPGHSASLGVLTTSRTCQKISKRATLRKDEAVVNGRERRGYLAYHKAGLIEEDFQLPCLVKYPAVARYGTELRSRYIDNDGGDNDGSDGPVTESDGGPVLRGRTMSRMPPTGDHAPESIYKSHRHRRVFQAPIRHRSRSKQCACAAKLVQVDGGR
jgi:hypothetical protein